MKLMKFLTFTVYVRIIIEAYLLLTLSTVSELYKFNLDTLKLQISFGVSILLCVFIILVPLIILYLWRQSQYVFIDTPESKFVEVFNGTKDTN